MEYDGNLLPVRTFALENTPDTTSIFLRPRNTILESPSYFHSILSVIFNNETLSLSLLKDIHIEKHVEHFLASATNSIQTNSI